MSSKQKSEAFTLTATPYFMVKHKTRKWQHFSDYIVSNSMTFQDGIVIGWDEKNLSEKEKAFAHSIIRAIALDYKFVKIKKKSK